MQTIELSNVQATRIALDPSGQHIALAGVHDLTVLSLERSSQPHSISLNAKSDPAGLQWHPNDSSRLAVLRNNRCELLLWDAIEGRVSVSHRLSGYVRPLSSLNWSSLQPYMLATSSADQFRAICLWDLRDLSRPARAIESLSPPNLIKWNKTQSLKFASSHRSSIRVWDMRMNLPEYHLSDPQAVVTYFDWAPNGGHELVAANQNGRLLLWDIMHSEVPKQEFRLTNVQIHKVLYTPSGDHVLTLPEPVNWRNAGIGVWNARNLQKPPIPLWVNGALRGTSAQPRPSDPVIKDMAWRTFSDSNIGKCNDEDDFFKHDLDRPVNTDSSNKGSSRVELVVWSLDQRLRFYPINCPSLDQMSTKETQATANEPSVNFPEPIKTSDVNATSVEERRFSKTNSETLSVFRQKARTDDSGQKALNTRSGPVSASASTSISVQPERSGAQEDSAYRILAQELSLLSPRAGQYKLQEVDLISRSVKIILYYCRRRHFHHYTVCSVSAGSRGRRPSADLEEDDLESLLQPQNDLVLPMDGSARTEHWRQPEKFKSSSELDALSGDEQSQSQPQQQKVRYQSTATPTGKESMDEPIECLGEMNIPISGSVVLSVSFPMAYPAKTPIFNVISHNPTLPNELVEQLVSVLDKTAVEFVHTSRGCMEPCIRKAVDLLQTISSSCLFHPSSHLHPTLEEEPVLKVSDTNERLINGTVTQSLQDKMQSLFLSGTEEKHASRTPFPRTSGVCFSNQGFCVMFGLPHPFPVTCSKILDNTFPVSQMLDSHRTPRTFGEFKILTQFLRSSSKNILTTQELDVIKKDNEQSHKCSNKDTLSASAVEDSVQKNSVDRSPTSSVIKPKSGDDNCTRAPQTSDALTKAEQSSEPLESSSKKTSLQSSTAISFSLTSRSIVQVYDLHGFILDKNLVQSYSLNNENVQEMCLHNCMIAVGSGRKDLIRFWQYAAVLSASFSRSSTYPGVIPPWPTQPVGCQMFSEWLNYFLSLKDVQNLAMAILALQGLDVLYRTQNSSPQLSADSAPDRSPTCIDETTRQRASVDTCALHRSSQTSQPTLYDNSAKFPCSRGLDLSPDTTVSFTLDVSDEPPAECTSMLEREDDEDGTRISTTDRNRMTGLQHNHSVREEYPRRTRFLSSEDLPRLAHCVAMYATVLHSMRAFIRHARLIRAWVWGVYSRSAFRPPIYRSRTEAMVQSHASSFWPIGSHDVLLIPSCPLCDSATTAVPSDLNNCRAVKIECNECGIQYCQSETNMNEIPVLNSQKSVPRLLCSICRTRVKGLIFVCDCCNHGGHIDHLAQWFNSEGAENQSRQCPVVGCRCHCALPTCCEPISVL
ncbi:unnamed protein product [Calicophoron daubneyi]|uniref:RWD domain-containing protein n=1 Tax=Calicophoron daubneyi TaxID=300641 RepID=A0AAV2TTV3_CALDB